MTSKPEIAKCLVTAWVSGEKYSASTLYVEMRVGTLPSVSLTGVQSDKTVMRPVTSDAVAVMRRRQEARLAGRSDTDVLVEAEDGFGRSLRFTGFLVAPSLEASKSHISDQITALGADALIDGLDLSVYAPGGKFLRAQADPGPLAAAYEPTEKGDVPGMLKAITEVLLSEDVYQESLQKAEQDESLSVQRLVTQQHQINKGRPSEIWKGILDASDVKMDTWVTAMGQSSKHEDIRNTIVAQAGAMLNQKDSGFWNSVQRVSQAFQMLYIPSPDGRGRFIRTDDQVKGDTTDMDVSGLRVKLIDGSQRIMQPGGVVMTGAGFDMMRPEAVSGTGIAGQYPAQLQSGYIHRDSLPAWLMDEHGNSLVARSDPPESGDANFNLEDLIERFNQSSEDAKKANDVIADMLGEMCRIIFEDIRLADSRMNVSGPLNFAYEPGMRVAANLGDNVTVTGFLAAVRHSISLVGKDFSGTTSFELTHIEF